LCKHTLFAIICVFLGDFQERPGLGGVAKAQSCCWAIDRYCGVVCGLVGGWVWGRASHRMEGVLILEGFWAPSYPLVMADIAIENGYL